MYILPDSLRSALAKPLDKVHTTESAVPRVTGRFLICVGDVCTQEFLKKGVVPAIVIVDGKTRRNTDLGAFKERLLADTTALVLHAPNPAATLTEELWAAIVQAMAADRRALIEVDGEEDLAVLPCILLGPEGAIVAYGQPGEGVVLVTITPEARDRVRGFLSEMKST